MSAYSILGFISMLIGIVSLCLAIKYHIFYRKNEDDIIDERYDLEKGLLKPEDRTYKINYELLYKTLYNIAFFAIVIAIILIAIDIF